MKIRNIIISACFSVLVSCSPNRSISIEKPEVTSCELDTTTNYYYAFHPDFSTTTTEDSILTRHFSSRSIVIARALGIVPIVAQFIDEREGSTTRFELADKINDHIQLANFDIASIAAQIDCGVKRALRTTDALNKKESERVRRLTVLSIAIGASTAFFGGVLQLNEHEMTGEVIDITGGAIEASLALSLILSKPPSIIYRHPKNPLADVVAFDQKSTKLFPPAVWFYLTRVPPNDQSIAQHLSNSWREVA